MFDRETATNEALAVAVTARMSREELAQLIQGLAGYIKGPMSRQLSYQAAATLAALTED